MRTGHYTRLKGRVTYFRRKVPQFLQERLASTEICYRLGVISSQLAERLGRKLAVEVDTFFDQAKIDPMLNSQDLSKIVNVALAGWRENDAAEYANEISRYGRPLLDAQEQAKAWAQLAKGLIKETSSGGSAYDSTFVSDMAKSAGVDIGDGPEAIAVGSQALSLGLAAHYLQSALDSAAAHYLKTGKAKLPVKAWQDQLSMLEAHLGVSQKVIPVPDENRAPNLAPPVASLGTKASTDQPIEAVTATSPSSRSATAAYPELALVDPHSTQSISFSQMVQICLEIRIANKQVSADIKDEIRSSQRIWTEIVGDRAIDSFNRSHFLAFRSALQQVPKNYWKSEDSRKLSIQEVIAWARADALASWAKTVSVDKQKDAAASEQAASNYIRIGNVTINKHLSMIAPIFDWALKNHYLPESTRIFWTNLHLPTGQRVTGLKPNEERPAYSHSQIQKIAMHPVWLGRRSEYFYNAPGQVIIRDSLYWGLPIALLHGMRREEFAQLRVRHVRQLDEVWVFDLHASGLNLKNSPSMRYVPLHSWILKLGFVEALIDGRGPNEYLFPELSADGGVEKFGDALGKRFARILEHSGIVVIRKNSTESDGGFHPLRHRFITDLLRAGVREGLVDYLSGHASGARERERDRGADGERERYTEDPPVDELKEAIERLPVSVDFQVWIDAWKMAIKTRQG